VNNSNFKETLLALVRDLFTFSSKAIQLFIIVTFEYKKTKKLLKKQGKKGKFRF
jgi:hypothetical protein